MTMRRFIFLSILFWCATLVVTAQTTDSIARDLLNRGEWFELRRYCDTHKHGMSHDMKKETGERLCNVFGVKRKWSKTKHGIVIPFRLDSVGTGADRSVAIMMPASVNGHRADFMLDTGASINVVSPSVAEQLGLKITEENINVEGNHTTTGKRAMADTLRIGNMTLRNVTFYIMDMSSGVDSIDRHMHHLDAIMGLPLIEQLQTCEIDFTRHTIRTVAGSDDNEPNICYLPGEKTLTMEAWHTGEPLHVIPDTGASHSTLDCTYLSGHGSRMVADGVDSVRYAGFGGIISGHEYRLTDFEITVGHTYYTLPRITVFDGQYGQRLGMDYFSRMERVFIDLRKMQVRVIR